MGSVAGAPSHRLLTVLCVLLMIVGCRGEEKVIGPERAEDGQVIGKGSQDDGVVREESVAAEGTRTKHTCSRKTSRAVRELVKNEILFMVAERNFELPLTCPFHEANDKFREQEAHKNEQRSFNWKCKYCMKLFRTESYIDAHMDNRHGNELQANTTTCLADYCNILHCDESHPSEAHCSPMKMVQLKYRCEAVLHKCFPADQSETAHDLYDFFQKEFCSHFVCGDPVKGTRTHQHPPKRVPRAEGTPNVKRVLYYVLLTFVGFMLLLFYVGMWLWKREVTISHDLRRLSSTRQANRLKFWKTQKLKGY